MKVYSGIKLDSLKQIARFYYFINMMRGLRQREIL